MRVTQVGNTVITIGWLIAVLVLILAILGMLGVLPETPLVLFGLIAALAVARLL
jgi:hypothetical protein